jgi:hypothetical protein
MKERMTKMMAKMDAMQAMMDSQLEEMRAW